METMHTTEDEQDTTYLVINQWGPLAAGDKHKCLAFIQEKLTEQSEQAALVNPASFRLKKVAQL